MALDIYVGGFARYFACEWENVAQKWSRENQVPYRLIGPNGPPEPENWDEAAWAVANWKAAINDALGENLSSPLDWDESRNAPYFTDRPGSRGYGALLIWAAHAELGTKPPELYEGDWWSDEAYIECSKPKQEQRYRPIVCGSLWLPGAFEFSFDFPHLTETEVHICSNAALRRALRGLEETTFGGSPDTHAGETDADPGDDASLQALARFGLSMFQRLVDESVRHHLPMMLSI